VPGTNSPSRAQRAGATAEGLVAGPLNRLSNLSPNRGMPRVSWLPTGEAGTSSPGEPIKNAHAADGAQEKQGSLEGKGP
jgi:hypothetical protein